MNNDFEPIFHRFSRFTFLKIIIQRVLSLKPSQSLVMVVASIKHLVRSKMKVENAIKNKGTRFFWRSEGTTYPINDCKRKLQWLQPYLSSYNLYDYQIVDNVNKSCIIYCVYVCVCIVFHIVCCSGGLEGHRVIFNRGSTPHTLHDSRTTLWPAAIHDTQRTQQTNTTLSTTVATTMHTKWQQNNTQQRTPPTH